MGWGNPFKKIKKVVNKAVSGVGGLVSKGYNEAKKVVDRVEDTTKNLYENRNSLKDWNSLGDFYNNTTQVPGEYVTALTGSKNYGNVFKPPTWEEWGSPGQAFAGTVDEYFAGMDENMQQLGPQIIGIGLNFVPGVGPWLSAAYNTAYAAGKAQETGRTDWNDLGKTALKNFGTAAVSQGLNKLTSGGAQASNPGSTPNEFSMRSGFEQSKFATPQTAQSATSSFQPGLIAGGTTTSTTGGVPSLVGSGASIANSYNVPQSSVPSLNTSSVGKNSTTKSPMDSFVDAGKGIVTDMASNAITEQLTPEQSQPITNNYSLLSPEGVDDAGYQFGDVLKAFGGSYTPNASGNRIGQEDFAEISNRINANNMLNQFALQDKFKPAGQESPYINTPYGNQMSNLNLSTQKNYQDLLNEINNYNRYYSIIDANSEDLDENMMNYMIQNPDKAPEAIKPYLEGLRPMDMFNAPLLTPKLM